MIEHSNIIYMPNISALGGIETYVYELVKKYHDLDIAVVSKKCDEKQAERIRKYCRLYIHTNQQIKCDVAIINYDQSIIKYINEDAKIYQTIHADYTNPVYDHKPKPNPKITSFIAITDFLKDRMSEILKPNEVMLCRNPLTIEPSKTIVIVSATRLHEHKGSKRMEKLLIATDKVLPKNTKILWITITGDMDIIKHPNMIFVKNRLDIDRFLNIADYVCLLSDTEADSYTLKEALYRNIPIITTPLPYLEEIGVKDGVNSYIVDFDCSNIEDVAKKLPDIPKFTYERLEDKYNEIFTKVKSRYEEEKQMKVKVRCILNYYDIEEDERKVTSEAVPYENPEKHPNRIEWITTKERADHLVSRGKVVIIEYIKDKPENKKTPTKTEKRKK